MNLKIIGTFASALVALLIAVASAYVSLDRRVEERPREAQVRQLIDDKTADKFFEVFRLFSHMEQRFDRIDQELSKQNNKRN